VIRQRLTESYVDGPDGPGYDYPALGAPGESDRRPAR
jgi:hypothetical protein